MKEGGQQRCTRTRHQGLKRGWQPWGHCWLGGEVGSQGPCAENSHGPEAGMWGMWGRAAKARSVQYQEG